MVLIRKQLDTGVVQPQCPLHAGNIFCRDSRVCHLIKANGDGCIQADNSTLSTDIIGGGIRTCDITCAQCLSEAARRKPV